MQPRIVALGSTTHRNRIGRAFSLWLTACAAGIEFHYICVDDGPVWEPLRDHREFLADVHTVRDTGELVREARRAVGPNTTVVVCKPRPELLRVSLRLQNDAPVVVDIDDPELLDPWGGSSLILRAKRIARFGPSPFRFGWARRVVRRMSVITSNPLLQRIYGGIVVPHVRELGEPPLPREPRTATFTVGFIGTPRDHKGLDEIRSAVAGLAHTRDVRLCVTASAPADAYDWEEWIGETSLAEGRKVLERCDAVAIVSRSGTWGDLQLPVKLIDAMAAGVPAVVSARPPLLWATGGAAVVVRDDSVSDLQNAFAMVADDAGLASAVATAAWNRAREVFTPSAAAPHLLCAIKHAGSHRL